MTVLDPPSFPALEPYRDDPYRDDPFHAALNLAAAVDCPTVETPLRMIERGLAELDHCYCGHHQSEHWTRIDLDAGELRRGCAGCPRECPGYREQDAKYRFQRAVAHELMRLP